MEGTFGLILRDLLRAVVLVVIPILTKYFVDYLKIKQEEREVIIGNEIANNLLSGAFELVGKAVDMVSQTFVDDLKKSGQFTLEAHKQAAEKALTVVLQMMSADVSEFIEDNYNDLELWVKTEIESYIKKSKLE